MALQTAYIAPGAYQTSAATMRNILRRLLPGTGPITPGFLLSSVAAQMQLTHNAFAAMITGSASAQGSYFVWEDGASGTIPFTASSAQGRWDAVVLMVADDEFGSVVARGPKWKVVPGTPAGSPAKLTDPQVAAAITEAGAYVRVADVLVPASVTDLTTATISYTWEDPYILKEVYTAAPTVGVGTGSWQNLVGTSTLSLKVPPSGKFEVAVAAHCLNTNSGAYTAVSYAISGGATVNEEARCMFVGSGSQGQRGTARRIFSIPAAAGASITITPRSFYPGGTAAGTTGVSEFLLQARGLEH